MRVKVVLILTTLFLYYTGDLLYAETESQSNFYLNASYGFTHFHIPGNQSENYQISDMNLHTVSYGLSYELNEKVFIDATSSIMLGTGRVLEKQTTQDFDSQGLYSQFTQGFGISYFFFDSFFISSAIALSVPLYFFTVLDRYYLGPSGTAVGGGSAFDQRKHLRFGYFSLAMSLGYIFKISERVSVKLDCGYAHSLSAINLQNAKVALFTSNIGLVYRL